MLTLSKSDCTQPVWLLLRQAPHNTFQMGQQPDGLHAFIRLVSFEAPLWKKMGLVSVSPFFSVLTLPSFDGQGMACCKSKLNPFSPVKWRSKDKS